MLITDRNSGNVMDIAVLKLSGKALNEIFANDEWIDTIINLKNSHRGLIIVHGAGQNISEWSAALGLESKFINGQRVTTEKIMDRSCRRAIGNVKF